MRNKTVFKQMLDAAAVGYVLATRKGMKDMWHWQSMLSVGYRGRSYENEL